MRRILLVLVLGLACIILIDRFGRGALVASSQAADGDIASRPSPQGASRVASQRDARLEYLTVQSMTARVQPGAAPTVLVLYGTNCPLSRELMPGLQQIATQYQSAGLRVLALNIDEDERFYDVPAFLVSTGASFPPARVFPLRPGDLAAALNSLGSKVIPSGERYTMPVVVVWGRRGTVLAEAQGMPDASALEQVVRAAVDPGS